MRSYCLCCRQNGAQKKGRARSRPPPEHFPALLPGCHRVAARPGPRPASGRPARTSAGGKEGAMNRAPTRTHPVGVGLVPTLLSFPSAAGPGALDRRGARRPSAAGALGQAPAADRGTFAAGSIVRPATGGSRRAAGFGPTSFSPPAPVTVGEGRVEGVGADPVAAAPAAVMEGGPVAALTATGVRRGGWPPGDVVAAAPRLRVVEADDGGEVVVRRGLLDDAHLAARAPPGQEDAAGAARQAAEGLCRGLHRRLAGGVPRPHVAGVPGAAIADFAGGAE